MNTIKNH